MVTATWPSRALPWWPEQASYRPALTSTPGDSAQGDLLTAHHRLPRVQSVWVTVHARADSSPGQPSMGPPLGTCGPADQDLRPALGQQGHVSSQVCLLLLRREWAAS